MSPSRHAAPPMQQARFRAMGTDVHVVVVDGDAELLRLGAERIEELERRWSRFLPTSDVSRLNQHAGHPVMVSPDTFGLVGKAVAAWQATGGLFDPTVGAAVAAHGYDRDFMEIVGPVVAAASAAPSTTPADIDLDPILEAVTLPPGVSFDAGGIGKGLAADLTVTALHDAGAAGALVNVGGDLRVIGRPPTSEGWVVTVPDPTDTDTELMRLSVREGAVATSSRLQRRWRTTAGEAHHLIDPRTGNPCDNAVVAVTVVAGEAWWAEALTKLMFLLGPDGRGAVHDVHAVLVTSDGARHATSDMEATLR